MFSLQISDTGVEEALQNAANLDAKALSPELQLAGDALVALVRTQFATEQDPYGEPWEPLSLFTVALKGNDRVLTETGRLRESIAADVTDTGISLFTDRRFDNGDDATKHQFGGTGSLLGTEVPARPIFPMDGSLPKTWLQVITENVANGVERIFA